MRKILFSFGTAAVLAITSLGIGKIADESNDILEFEEAEYIIERGKLMNKWRITDPEIARVSGINTAGELRFFIDILQREFNIDGGWTFTDEQLKDLKNDIIRRVED